MAERVWFWQRIISPHMAGLAAALAQQGRNVTYVAEKTMSPGRAALGWSIPDLGHADLKIVGDERSIREIISLSSNDDVHISQGIRGNGRIGLAQKLIAKENFQHWIMLETINELNMITSMVKKIDYRIRISNLKNSISGVLAIGHSTPDWLSRRGMQKDNIFPFAYFLPGIQIQFDKPIIKRNSYKFLFVGRLVELKRLDLLIGALKHLSLEFEFELDVIGAGELETALKELAHKNLPGRVNWLGQKSLSEVPLTMARADCLVLPSSHDGWGAVVSEALMVGIPTICSDRCGCAEVVEYSGFGGVFRAGDRDDLYRHLRLQLQHGSLPTRMRRSLAQWALSLEAQAGAAYLDEILEWRAGSPRPSPPWRRNRPIITDEIF